MKKPLIYLVIPALLAAGCHRSGSDSLQRQQQQYDTVQEGQSSTAVTSTITAPGEVAPPAAGMTGTNSDTTTNFTLPQVSSTSTTQNQPGTLAGTLPVQSNSAPMSGYPSNPPQQVRPKPRPPAVTKTEPATTDTTTTSVNAPPPATSTTPPTTDTAPPPPPSTDTQPPPTTTTGGLGPQASGPRTHHPIMI